MMAAVERRVQWQETTGERRTGRLRRPRTLVAILVATSSWAVVNALLGHATVDPPPSCCPQGVVEPIALQFATTARDLQQVADPGHALAGAGK